MLLKLAAACGAILTLLALAGCGAPPATPTPAEIMAATAPPTATPPPSPVAPAAAQAGVTPDFGCVIGQPQVTATLPPDTIINDQKTVNCFAWQSFIALNWAADPAQRGQPDPSQPPQAFGKPGDAAPVVWETYKLAEDIFLPGAPTPEPWNTPDSANDVCQTALAAANMPRIRLVTANTKLGVRIPEVLEATGDLLIDQNSDLVHFEKRVNETEFTYITQNELYDANNQVVLAETAGFRLPDGSIEIKAAWRLLNGEPTSVTNRFKQTQAIVYDPDSGKCGGPYLLGLVGLHIIRKTPSMQQIMWSTFEQIDNVPGSPGDAPPHYSFYNPSCQAPAPCEPNATPLPTPTPPGTPDYQPVQVERVNSLQGDIESLNLATQSLIKQTNPDSVWQYYQLINVLWPQNSQLGYPAAGATTPVDISRLGFTSSGPQSVSNVTLETYIQNFTCTTCHVQASVAPSQKATCKPNLAAGFSFVFDDADTPDHFRDSCQ